MMAMNLAPRTEVGPTTAQLQTVVPLRRALLKARGIADADIRSAVRRGELAVLRPGRYLEASDFAQASYEQRHRLLVESLAPDLAPASVVSRDCTDFGVTGPTRR